MDLPQPPQDTDLRNIIDKLAQFVARNGREFERMTKTKQKNNPKFSFLYGGEHFNYYQYKVTTEQAILKQSTSRLEDAQYQYSGGQQTPAPAPSLAPGVAVGGPPAPQWLPHMPPDSTTAPPGGLPSLESILTQQATLRDQIKQSESNLNAQHTVLIQQQQTQVEETVAGAQSEMIQRLSVECNISLTEFDSILQPIIDSCTKDSISAGKGWILSHATTPNGGKVVSQYLLKKLTTTGATFTQKLHLIYLVNDVLHHCARKNAEDLKKCLEAVVVPMFCNTSIAITEEQETKLNKLLKLWESKSNYFEQSVIDKMKNPTNSYQEYQANLISQYANLITPLTLQTKMTFENYQKQHQAFVTHTLQQIQQLDVLKQVTEEQISLNSQMNQDQNNLPQNNIQNQMQQQNTNFPSNNNFPEMFNQSGPIQNTQQIMSYEQQQFCNSNQPLFPPGEQPQLQGGYGSSNGQGTNTETSAHYEFDQSYNQNSASNSTNNAGEDSISGLNLSQPPPGFFEESVPPSFQNGFPDLSKPPPGFSNVEVSPEDLLPSVPYFELPAGLMVPLITLEDCDYKPLEPDAIRLPPPAPPSERLLAAVKAFSAKPNHTRPQDSEGWEKLGLYEYYRAKNAVRKQKEDDIKNGLREKSRSPTPVQFDPLGVRSPPTRRYRSKSRSRSRSRSRSPPPRQRSPPRARSPSPERERGARRSSGRRPRRHSPVTPTSRSPPRPSERDSPEPVRFRNSEEADRPSGRTTRPPERSPTPPSFMGASFNSNSSNQNPLSELDSSNKGHQMLRRMGWGQGAGLGAAGQGIAAPIDAGAVRDRQDQYKGVGVNLNDPYENFRKNKGAAFITRMKERALERT